MNDIEKIDSILIATIGNRDVQLQNERIEPRVEGEKLLNKLKRGEKPDLSLPIILPAIKRIIKTSKIRKIILVVTDQPESVAQDYRSKDTIFFGEITKQLLINHYKKLGLSEKPAEKIEVLRIQNQPTILSCVLNEIGEKYYSKLSKFNNEFKQVNLLTTGGIPSINSAILIISSRMFGRKLCFLRVDKDRAYPDKVVEKLEKMRLNDHILKLCDSYDFNNIASAISNAGFENDYPALTYLVNSLKQRILFDFESAIELLVEKKSEASSLISVFNKLEDDLALLTNESQNTSERRKLIIKELAMNTIIKFKAGSFVDAAGRVFRFIEEYAIYLIEKLLNIEMVYSSSERKHPNFYNFIEKNADLKEYLYNKRKDIDYKTCNIYVADLIFQYYIDSDCFANEQIEKAVKYFQTTYNSLEKLKQSRNTSIIAHGTKSIKSDDFPDDFVNKLVDSCLNLDCGDPLDSINQAVEGIKKYCKENLS